MTDVKRAPETGRQTDGGTEHRARAKRGRQSDGGEIAVVGQYPNESWRGGDGGGDVVVGVPLPPVAAAVVSRRPVPTPHDTDVCPLLGGKSEEPVHIPINSG